MANTLASLKNKIEFLKAVIEAAEHRREALESRFGVLIAADAILLSAVIGIGLRGATLTKPLDTVQVTLALVSLISVIFSTLWSVQILIPFSSQERRSKIMDVPKDPTAEHNLYFFLRIADRKKDEYREEIKVMTEEEIYEQFLSEAHNISRLLRNRYSAMSRSLYSFAIAAGAFAILAIIRLFSE